MRIVKQANNLLKYFFLLFLPFFGFAESETAGTPFIKNYSPKEYGASSQNWAIVQDDRGIMYFGNSNGILEYDGIAWRLIKTKDNAVVRSLAKDKQGKIYVGTFGDFGFLVPDSTGTLQYRSLKEKIPEKYHDFADIWNIHVIQEKIFFKSYKYLFELFNNKIKVHAPQFSEFNDSHVCNDTLYIEYWQVGLGKLVNDSISLVLTKNDFEDNYPGVGLFIPNENKQILLGNPNSGLFLFDGKEVTKFKNEVDKYLIENESYHGIKLDNNRFAFSTLNGGVVIMNKNGSMENVINKTSGLVNNTVWQIYVDSQNSIWMATDNGISHAEYPSPISKFENFSESEGTINQILRFKNELYLATINGLFYLKDGETSRNISNQFNIIEGLDEQTWSIIAFEDALVVGTKSGVYRVKNHNAAPIRNDNSVYLIKSEVFSNRIYIGLTDGLASMHFKNGRWIDDGKIEGISEYINNKIVEQNNGDLWLGHYQGIIYVDFPDEFSTTPIINKYDKNDGLPASDNNYVFSISGNTCFATSKGIYKFYKSRNQFIPDSSFGADFANGNRSVFTITEDNYGKIWMYSNNEIGFNYKNESRKYIWENKPFLRLSDFNISTIYPDKKEVVWFGGSDGLFNYTSNISKTYELPNSSLIRKISTQNDSVLYGGFVIGDEQVVPEYEYELNALRFEFSLPSYDNEKANRFQYYLEGFDRNWSQWTNEPKANYTNIPEGRYLFRVRAENIYKVISKEAIYAFKILPPWYRAWWAFGFYAILILGTMMGLLKLRSFKLEKEKSELEKIIRDRTDDIQIKNKLLEEQAEKLQEMDKIKSRFFANISHEFRTPLTLIKGPAEEMLNKNFQGKPEKAFGMILRNANRLLKLINQLLDLSRLESGSLELRTALQPISSYIGMVINLFSSLSESRNILLQYIKPPEEIEIYFDRDKMENILCNLLSNAFKFTPENGYITVTLQRISPNPNFYPNGAVEIGIHDSGLGIPASEVDNIFKRFNQGQNSKNHFFDGSGIGLALTKELVDLHRGEINVTSVAEEGTKFDVIFPMGKDHLRQNEISEKNGFESVTNMEKDIHLAGFTSETEHLPVQDKPKNTGEKDLVLIVEDNAEVRNYIRGHFERDYEVIESENGSKGVNIARDRLPDLIVSDVMMPEMDGYKLTDTLKKDSLTSHIPIILLTAKASDEAKIEGLETGADAYMPKPFNATELKVRTKKLIETRKKLREKFKKEFFLEPEEINAVSLDDEFLARMYKIIEKEMYDSEFNVEILLKEFALGQRQFTRKVVALTGQTPVQFIRVMRLKRAKNLIEQGAGNISQIAFDVGFNNLSYFSKCFHQQFKKLPSEIVQ